jgi:WD40 repeat protein
VNWLQRVNEMATTPGLLSSTFTDSLTHGGTARPLVVPEYAMESWPIQCSQTHWILHRTFSRSMFATALLSSFLLLNNPTNSIAQPTPQETSAEINASQTKHSQENADGNPQCTPVLIDEHESNTQRSPSQRASYTAAVFSADGQHIILGSQAGVEIRSWPDLQSLETIPTQLEHVHDLSFSSDGQTMLIAGGSPAETGIVEVIDWKTRTTRSTVPCHDDVVYQVRWSDDDRSWATTSADGVCKIFDSQSIEIRQVFSEHSRAVLSLCWLPSSGAMASAGVDQTVRIWNAEAGTLTRTLDNHTRTVSRVLRRPNPTGEATEVIATAGEDRTVRFWQPLIGRLMRFAKLDSVPLSMVWSDDAEKLFVGCDDGKIRIVNFSDATILGTISALDGPIHEVLDVPQSTRIFVVGHGGYSLINAGMD